MKKILFSLIILLSTNMISAQTVLSESFENTAATGGWTQEQHGVLTVMWVEGNGPLVGSLPVPDGSNYATYVGVPGSITSMITPEIDLSAIGTDSLSFHYALRNDGSVLELFYKTSYSGSWTQIPTSLPASLSWTYKTIALPNTNSTYYIAFRCTAQGSGGLDAVSVDMVNVYNDITTGIKKQDNKEITITPNPNNGIFEIRSDLNIKRLSVLNIIGEVVFSTNTSLTSTIIDISDQANGIYFIKIETNDGVITSKKIIKS